MLKNGATPTKFSWGNGQTYEEYLLSEHEKEKAAMLPQNNSLSADEQSLTQRTKEKANETATAAAALATDSTECTTTAHTDNNDTVITAANASESIETPKSEPSTSHATKIAQSAKKSSSRLRAANAEADSGKSRSSSADEQLSGSTNAKSDRTSSRKSIDPTQPQNKSQIEVKSPLKRLDTVSTLATGAKVEVLDLNGGWHAARVVEVDQTEQEVFINFEKSLKTKGPRLVHRY